MPNRRSYTADQVEQIRQLHSQGLNDREIRERTGLSANVVHRVRRDTLGLTARPLGEVRAEAFWSYAPSLGWPVGIRYRAVQILELLFAHESLTRRQIPELLGLRSSVALNSNDPQGTYLANLISRGLVAAAGRSVRTGELCADGRTHKGKSINLYFLTPAAREMKQAWLARRDRHAEPSSPPTEERLS